MKKLLLLCTLTGLWGGACQPQDVLNQQGRTLRNTDYVQVAMDEKRKQDQARAAEEQKVRAAQEEIRSYADAGQRHMDLFEYEPAMESFKAAYRLSNDPVYLVKVAEAERATGDCGEAQAMYRQYLEKRKDAPDRKSIEARIAEAKSCEGKAGGNVETVRRLYKEGSAHYDLGEYDQAIGKFKEAYRMSNDPAYLFNIAQAYRMDKNCAEAGRFYQRFLSVAPDAPNRDKIEARVAEMKACSK